MIESYNVPKHYFINLTLHFIKAGGLTRDKCLKNGMAQAPKTCISHKATDLFDRSLLHILHLWSRLHVKNALAWRVNREVFLQRTLTSDWNNIFIVQKIELEISIW